MSNPDEVTIEVSTERGGSAVVCLRRRPEFGGWSVVISDELIASAPEGVVAILTMAVLDMKARFVDA